jgi:hypothetical protein
MGLWLLRPLECSLASLGLLGVPSILKNKSHGRPMRALEYTKHTQNQEIEADAPRHECCSSSELLGKDKEKVEGKIVDLNLSR